MDRMDTISSFVDVLHEYNEGPLTDINDTALNLNDIAEQVMLGPQQEVMESVAVFNSMFDMDIGITKRFRFKAGYMDQIKDLYEQRVLLWWKRNNGIKTFFNRIENGHWVEQRIKRKLIEINDKLYFLRSQQASFQDNTQAVLEKWEEIKNYIDIFEEKSTDNIQFKVYIKDYDRNCPQISVIIRLSNINMKIFNGNRREENFIAEIPVEPNIYMILSFPMIKMLNQTLIGNWDTVTLRTNNYVKGILWGERDRLSFPYISRRDYNNEDTPFRNVCLGDFNSAITQAMMKFDGDVLLHYLKEWYSIFQIGHTHPYNQPSTMIHGIPNFLDKDKVALLSSPIIWDLCSNVSWGENDDGNEVPFLDDDPTDSYCDRFECALREKCIPYKEFVLRENVDHLQGTVQEEDLPLPDVLPNENGSTDNPFDRPGGEIPVNILRSAIPLRASDWEMGEDGVMRRIQQGE